MRPYPYRCCVVKERPCSWRLLLCMLQNKPRHHALASCFILHSKYKPEFIRPASLASSPLHHSPPQVAKGPLVANVMTNGIRILDVEEETREQEKDRKPIDAMMEADEEMARKLQAKMAAQEYGRARWG